MTAVQAVATVGVLSLAAVAPELGRALGLSPSLIGYQVSITYAGGMLTSFIGGQVVRRLGAIGTSQLAMALCATGAAIACLPSLAFLALGSFVIGLCYGLTNPAAAHLLAKIISPANRNLVFSIKQTGVPLGGVVAGLAAPRMALAFGWQSALLLAAVLAVCMLAAIAALRQRWDGDRQPRARIRFLGLGGVGVVWRQPSLRALSLFTVCFATLQLCLMTYVVTLLVSEAGRDLVAAGLALAVAQAAGVIGRVGWGLAADRLRDGQTVLLVIGGIVVLAAGALTQVSPSWPDFWVYAVLAVLGATAVGWNGVTLAELVRLSPPDTVGAATGGLLFYSFAGVLVGPIAFSLSYGWIGSYAVTFGSLGLLGLAGMACVLAMRRAEKRIV